MYTQQYIQYIPGAQGAARGDAGGGGQTPWLAARLSVDARLSCGVVRALQALLERERAAHQAAVSKYVSEVEER